MSTLHLVDAAAPSTKNNVCTYGYFTLQRSQPQHTVDILISAEQRLACNEIIIQNEERIIMAFCSHNTEVTLTYEQGALRQNGTLTTVINNFTIFHSQLLKKVSAKFGRLQEQLIIHEWSPAVTLLLAGHS